VLKPVKQVLLDDVEDVSFSYYSAKTQGSNGSTDIEWKNFIDTQPGVQLAAVKVSITTSDYDKIYRVFEVAQ